MKQNERLTYTDHALQAFFPSQVEKAEVEKTPETPIICSTLGHIAFDFIEGNNYGALG